MDSQKPEQRDERPEPRHVRVLADVLWEEFVTIHGGEVPTITDHADDALLTRYHAAALDKRQSALCLSGGGIRSAAFSLGVLQALARKNLLGQFHYLSTVSGGGYIGGWLTALIGANKGNVAAVERLLAGENPAAEIGKLRQFTNFLTPQPGLASTDTWAGVVLWVRNVLINWLLFAPALFALALAPIFYRDLITSLSPAFGIALLLLGYASLAVGVYFGARHLPSHDATANAGAAEAGMGDTPFAVRWVVWPIMGWAALVPLVAAPSLRMAMPDATVPVSLIPIGCFVVMTGAYVVAGLRSSGQHRAVFRGNFIWWTAASFLATVVLQIGLTLGQNRGAVVLAVVGPLWVTAAHLVQSLFYVALRRESFRGDLDREWLARLSALKVIPALLWAVFACVCLLLPYVVFGPHARVLSWIAGLVGVLSGPGAALLGKSAMTAFGRDGKDGNGWPISTIDILVGVATALFAIVLFTALAYVGDKLTLALAPPSIGHDPHPASYRWVVDAAAGLAAYFTAYGLGRRINVNRFSMHAVYRQRLVRAFLGSARSQRNPDVFTDIDPRDNPRMNDVFPRPAFETPPQSRALFPVVNLALNLTAGHNTAWTERKAESFTVTPLASGAANLHRMEDASAGKPVRGAYAVTKNYAGDEKETGPDDNGTGMTLGTAITLSGAAVSPNMGYHSSAATAFLMTLFNVRLGAWLPNPAVVSARDLRKAKPPNALFTLARELLGRTDDVGPTVYLSDGGHFDDLGVYEMIRRRCRLIVVVDAGQDPNARFDDLGNAARKVFIDFGVKLVFRPDMTIGSRDVPIKPIHGYAFADIVYPNEISGGRLIYIKPCDMTNAPVDVRAFRNANEQFPHETTLDQWFSESRFESYRGLGDAEMSALCPADSVANWNSLTLDAFFDKVREQITALHKTPKRTRPPRFHPVRYRGGAFPKP